MNLTHYLLLITVYTIPILFAITLHEVSHGWVANKLGDPTARLMGRITLNPIKHIDPIGTVIVPIICLYLGNFIFGWAKPVPVDYRNLGKPRRDMAIVAAAGPVSNFLMALFWGITMKLGVDLMQGGSNMGAFLRAMGQIGVLINLVLMVLNLIPLPPLDGSRVVSSFLPDSLAEAYNRLEPFGFLILVALLVTGILIKVLGPPVIFLRQLIFSLVGIG